MTVAVCTILAWACLLELRLWWMRKKAMNTRRLAAFAVEPCPKGGSHRWGPTSGREVASCTACRRIMVQCDR